MIYKDFQNLKLSALGMGAMRLPITSGNDAMIDEAATAEMVDYAIHNGINYFDTAWGYHGGNSETVMAFTRCDAPLGTIDSNAFLHSDVPALLPQRYHTCPDDTGSF